MSNPLICVVNNLPPILLCSDEDKTQQFSSTTNNKSQVAESRLM